MAPKEAENEGQPKPPLCAMSAKPGLSRSGRA